jgi:hypothetical protein
MNRLALALPLVALTFLLLVAGAAAMHFGRGVPTFLLDIYDAIESAGQPAGSRLARDVLQLGAKPQRADDLPHPPAPAIEPGVKISVAEAMQPGYTLYSAVADTPVAVLVDEAGKPQHSWRVPTATAADADYLALIGGMHLYPDGRLLVSLHHQKPGSGGGIVMLDKDSNILWRFDGDVRAALEVLPDGRIVGALSRRQETPWPGLETIVTPFFHEEIIVLSPTGDTLAATSVLAAIQNSAWNSILQYADPDATSGEILHVAAVRYLDAANAVAFPGADAGDLLLLLRDIDTLLVLDPADATVGWAARGPWRMPHDIDVTGDGSVLVFDNRGDLGRGGATRLLEIDAVSRRIGWEWPGDSAVDLYTSVQGSAVRLANGNTLLAESNRGRLLEVTPAGELVWEFYVPERAAYADYEAVAASRAMRIDPALAGFLN